MHSLNRDGRLLAPLHSHPNEGVRSHFIILDLCHFLAMLSLFYWAFNILYSCIIVIIGFCWFCSIIHLAFLAVSSDVFCLIIGSHKITIFSLTHFFKFLDAGLQLPIITVGFLLFFVQFFGG